jgi:hypothetical protein
MAGRSYLSRIARPLTAADPVVWSTPRASIDEARPIAPAARPASARPADPSALPPQPDAVAAGPVRSDRSPPPTSSARVPPPILGMGSSRLGIGETAPSVGATAPDPVRPAPTRPPIVRRARPHPVKNMDGPAPDGPVSRRGPPDFEVAPPASLRPVTLDAPATRHTDPGPSFPGSSDAPATAYPIEATETHDRPAASAPESQPRAPRRDAPPTRPPEGATRLHIGAIEIRVTRPPPPATTPPTRIIVQAPPAAPARLARTYASRFGLAQS